MAKTMSGQIPVKPSADSLATSAKAATNSKGLPPVHLWNPPYTGEIDIRIARDGTWYHEGSQIKRQPLVRLFSSILRKEKDRYYLVTPVEKAGIVVEDAPFVAVEFDLSNPGPDQVLTFETNVGDVVTAGAANKIRIEIDPDTDEPSPYIHVRNGLEALIDRKSFYRLIETGDFADIEGQSWFGLRSGGVFFPISPSDTLA